MIFTADIADIPDERVTDATGSGADVSNYVEIRLDSAADQKAIGRQGERVVYNYLMARRGSALTKRAGDGDDGGVSETIEDVKWLNEEQETGAPYDIQLTTLTNTTDGRVTKVRYIEVKATMSDSKMYFETSARELKFACDQGDKYDLYRVFNVGNEDRIKLIKLQNVARGLDEKYMRVFMVV